MSVGSLFFLCSSFLFNLIDSTPVLSISSPFCSSSFIHTVYQSFTSLAERLRYTAGGILNKLTFCSSGFFLSHRNDDRPYASATSFFCESQALDAISKKNVSGTTFNACCLSILCVGKAGNITVVSLEDASRTSRINLESRSRKARAELERSWSGLAINFLRSLVPQRSTTAFGVRPALVSSLMMSKQNLLISLTSPPSTPADLQWIGWPRRCESVLAKALGNAGPSLLSLT
mmetsp:Transcript_17694/g.23426  ORF Transcript_17694/g.23426 Transcript_17694/m.23426 type:complete len:232 (-) Transcript_17694:1081-1776(-)